MLVLTMDKGKVGEDDYLRLISSNHAPLDSSRRLGKVASKSEYCVTRLLNALGGQLECSP